MRVRNEAFGPRASQAPTIRHRALPVSCPQATREAEGRVGERVAQPPPAQPGRHRDGAEQGGATVQLERRGAYELRGVAGYEGRREMPLEAGARQPARVEQLEDGRHVGWRGA